MRLFLVAFATFVLGACGDEGSTGGHLAWHLELAPAAAESRATGKPILADFQGSDWCPPCQELHRTFLTQAFAQWAAKHVVLLNVDFPNGGNQPPHIRQANEQLAVKHGITQFPTLLLLDADGDKLAEIPVTFDAAELITAAEQVMPPAR